MNISTEDTINMEVQCIFSFDNKNQDIYDISMDVPINSAESGWIKSIIENVYKTNMDYTKDLWKMSLCINYDEERLTQFPMIKPMLNDYILRNGKYVFWPSYRIDDQVVLDIIEGTVIASETQDPKFEY